MTLADKRLFVVLPLRPHRDELQRVGSGAELSVDRLHAAAGAVGQVDAAQGLLGDGGDALNVTDGHSIQEQHSKLQGLGSWKKKQ